MARSSLALRPAPAAVATADPSRVVARLSAAPSASNEASEIMASTFAAGESEMSVARPPAQAG
eukprot:9477710-Pyramimonas_sp.AAC.1